MAQHETHVETNLGPGCLEVKFETFKQFVDYLYSDLLDFNAYIWRGQRCESWELEPTLDRLIRESDLSGTKRIDFAKRHLEAFKYAARGRRGANPPLINNDNDWWALGQHHGLPTPLLDWSNSPFVAAFFAFSDIAPDQTEHRAIYALHQPSVEKIVREKARATKKKNEEELVTKKKNGNLGLIDSAILEGSVFPDIVFVRPLSDENSRLVSQRGLFTRSHTALSIEDWVQENHPKDDESCTLLKFLVPNSERAKCLQLLNRMNINPLSLFPDLSGASQYCTVLAQIDRY
jgi:hypothetical protein